jgi:PAS domain S-box-containing protein
MSVFVEHAGAGRALLILPQDDTQRVEAEATTCRKGITVRVVGRTLADSDLPESMLRYVLQTRETVTLDDTLAPNLFSSDNYVAQKRARSILCLPLVKQTIIVGVLYFENATTSHAFTSDRVEVLKLLASQAAISMENARLFKMRQESEDRLRLMIDRIPAMVWSNSADGSVELINQRFLEYTGLISEMALGDGWLDAIHTDDVAGVVEIRREALAASKPYEFEARLRRADGEYRYFLVRVFPVRDETGKVVKGMEPMLISKIADERKSRFRQLLKRSES